MGKYKGIFRREGCNDTLICENDNKNVVINACVEFRYGSYSCDTKKDRREGLTKRNFAIIGYTSDELIIEETC